MAHETKLIERSFSETICAQPDCAFFEQSAKQGICFSAEGELTDWNRLAAHEKELEDSLQSMREREGDQYLAALESHYITAMMNWQFTLDECIRLRRDITLAKLAK